MALCLLWQAPVGEDGNIVSRVLTFEMNDLCIDDASIVTQRLNVLLVLHAQKIGFF